MPAAATLGAGAADPRRAVKFVNFRGADSALSRLAPKGTAMPAATALPLAFLLGVLAACGFAPLEAWPLTLGCLAGLLALLQRAATLRRAAAIGWWWGLGNFCLGLNWIATAFTFQAAMPAWLGWVAVVLLSLYLALYPAFGCALGWWLGRGHRGATVVALAGAWVLNEWLRATLFTGFAWNPVAAIWAPVWPVAGVAAWVGTYGLSGLTMLLAGGLLALGRLLWRSFRHGDAAQRRGRAIVLAVVAGGVLFAVGSLLFALARAPVPAGHGPAVRIVQPNIGQDEKWSEARDADHLARLAALTGRPGPLPRIVLWPEVAVPYLLEEDAAARATLARLLGPRDLLLVGAQAVQRAPDGSVETASNSLFALDPAGRLIGRYDKSHLVPYGEYLPMRPLLSALGLSRLAPGDTDFRPGPGPADIDVPGLGPVGVQICYEIIFSGRVVDRTRRPRFLFNPSNDAWFGRWGPPQHLAQARLRAIEEGLPVLRSTPTGISAIVDAHGRLAAALPWHAAGAIAAPLPDALPPTLFARAGNLLPLLLALLLAVIGFAWGGRPRYRT